MNITDEQAVQCATDQATLDIPYVEVTDAIIYRKIINEDRKLMHTGASIASDRWYVEIALRHPEDDSTAMVLYRVWMTAGGLKAMKVAVA